MSSNIDFTTVPEGVEGVNPAHPCARPMRILDAENGLVERTREKVAIIGYATSSRDAAPFDDPEYDIVGLNQLYRFIPRADAWFEIHSNWEEHNVEGTDHFGWLSKCGIPVFMASQVEGISTSVRFPLGPSMHYGADYFTNTVSYMIAWAIHQGYSEIALYGIDMVVGTEYQFQKACCEFWLGIAHGRGIVVRLPAECALLKHSHRYGYEIEPSVGLVSISELAARSHHLTAERDKAISKLHALDGAVHEVATIDKWKDDPAVREKWLRDLHGETLSMLATLDGALQECGYYRELLELRSRGAGVKTVS